MKFVPKYTVSYKGQFRPAGVPFPFDPEDRESLSPHGRVEPPPEPSGGAAPDKPAKKGGRPRKVSE